MPKLPCSHAYNVYDRIIPSGTTYNIELADGGNPNPGTPIQLWSRFVEGYPGYPGYHQR